MGGGGVGARTDRGPGPVAVLDLGANSFHLLVAERAPSGLLTVRADEALMVRLGSSMERRDGTAMLGRDATTRGHAAIRTLVERARSFSPRTLVGVATSIFREAADAPAFLQVARVRHGMTIEVLGGDEEARLTYLGVQSGLPACSGTTVVIEVGGGTAQIALGRGRECRATVSLPLGVTRLRHRVLRNDGVLRPVDVRAIASIVRSEVKEIAGEVRAAGSCTFVLAAGTARALAALCAKRCLTREEVIRVAGRLTGLPPATIGRLGVDAARQDTIATGAVVVATLLHAFDARSALVSDRGLREGVVVREA